MTYTIEQIKELCEKATAGKWQVQFAKDKTTRKKFNVWTDWGKPAEAFLCSCEYGGWDKKLSEQNANAKFIAASRTIIPELVAEVERLMGKLHAFKTAAQIVVDSHQMSCLGEDCQISGIDMLKYQLRNL